ncbi:hypothetical protein LEP1GSC103_3354 [Leptospira borgpetersenii serovar Javanica str. UI 09931]|uniref:Uncharacterized protein n=4 Tax=Leptospira borgpetersenii TaxID=174 RepID=M3HQ42_LEPBO|nr:hypothetical protein LEP1GSC128_2616 [Leptospira borgpetersenii str. 200801926]EKQ93236.1 hypothetical protein LEP1GSC101_3854 [Leptospira borgpetersenii str. UI 09149]EKQ98540.1 hypothetical protein LEP1GSC121_3376 [Leptospira borgpetersenii serovar Castellonis str. 200801910]EMF99784.1 hypothetical protein LEP1GSC123_3229 [Leptospira borgpetersenii str. 200701203]EMK09410.1 hypothetical protein LEP1GSC066_1464 [Leptospira sp. serovar Kenya str. Sh9]EMN11648.1 hypothetical protein LEP1GSC0
MKPSRIRNQTFYKNGCFVFFDSHLDSDFVLFFILKENRCILRDFFFTYSASQNLRK